MAAPNKIPATAEQKPRISKLFFYMGRPAQLDDAAIKRLKSLPFEAGVVFMLNDSPTIPFSTHGGIDKAILRANEAGIPVRVCSWARNDLAYCEAMIAELARLHGAYGVPVELDCENEVLQQGSSENWAQIVAKLRASEYGRSLGEVWITSLLPDKQRDPRLKPLVEWVNATGGAVAFQVYNYQDPSKPWSLNPGNEPGRLMDSYIRGYRRLGAKRLEPILGFFHRAAQGGSLHPGYTPSLALYHNVIVANDAGITAFGGWSWAALGDRDGAERWAFLEKGEVRFPGKGAETAGVDTSPTLAERAAEAARSALKVAAVAAGSAVIVGGLVLGVVHRKGLEKTVRALVSGGSRRRAS